MPYATASTSPWTQYHPDEDYLYDTEPDAYLKANRSALRDHGTVLCVADGIGRNSVWLAQQGYTVQAFDPSPLAVSRARRRAELIQRQVHYTVAALDGWPWRKWTHDSIVATFVHPSDPALRDRVFKGMCRSIKPGGTIVLHGYSNKHEAHMPEGTCNPATLYSKAYIAHAFRSIQTIELAEYEIELYDGSRRAGRATLLGYVGRCP